MHFRFGPLGGCEAVICEQISGHSFRMNVKARKIEVFFKSHIPELFMMSSILTLHKYINGFFPHETFMSLLQRIINVCMVTGHLHLFAPGL